MANLYRNYYMHFWQVNFVLKDVSTEGKFETSPSAAADHLNSIAEC